MVQNGGVFRRIKNGTEWKIVLEGCGITTSGGLVVMTDQIHSCVFSLVTSYSGVIDDTFMRIRCFFGGVHPQATL